MAYCVVPRVAGDTPAGVLLHQGLLQSLQLLSKAFIVATRKTDKAQLGHLTWHKALCPLSQRISDSYRRCLLAGMCPALPDSCGHLCFGPTGTEMSKKNLEAEFCYCLS